METPTMRTGPRDHMKKRMGGTYITARIRFSFQIHHAVCAHHREQAAFSTILLPMRNFYRRKE